MLEPNNHLSAKVIDSTKVSSPAHLMPGFTIINVHQDASTLVDLSSQQEGCSYQVTETNTHRSICNGSLHARGNVIVPHAPSSRKISIQNTSKSNADLQVMWGDSPI